MKNIVCMCFTIIFFSLFGIGKSFSELLPENRTVT